jgi:hypothetical protein
VEALDGFQIALAAALVVTCITSLVGIVLVLMP